MPKLAKHASKKAKQAAMGNVMHRYKHGQLHSGSKHGPLAKSRAQAIAIGLSESGQSKRKVGKKRGRKRGKGKR